MQHRFAAIKAFLDRQRTHAEAADLFDAAVMHQVRHDIECLADVFAVVTFYIRQTVDQVSPARDFPRQSLEHLLGAQVQIKTAAGIEPGRHLIEAVLFGGNAGATLRGRARRSGEG